MDVFLDSIASVLIVTGSLMSLVAGVGLLTFPDLLTRMHAATKPQVLGFLLLFLGLALHLRSWAILPALALAWIMQLLTAPVSAHMIGRSGYRTKHVNRDTLYSDELRTVVENASHEDAQSSGPAVKTTSKHLD